VNLGKSEPFEQMCDEVKLVATRLTARGVPLSIARGVVIYSSLCSWSQGLVCDRARRKACKEIVEDWIDRLASIWKAREASDALAALAGGADLKDDGSAFLSEAQASLVAAAAKRQGPPPRWYQILEGARWRR
jgi:hypothetical protein